MEQKIKSVKGLFTYIEKGGILNWFTEVGNHMNSRSAAAIDMECEN